MNRRGHCITPTPPGVGTGSAFLLFCFVAAFGIVVHVLVTYGLTPSSPAPTASATPSIHAPAAASAPIQASGTAP
ncbi:MAG TPA: hypothetical protein PLP29_05935 [Candidatus Ozemobacteraceae bacterium]|nr:hypothetical protein [Candidatus Ozemobacteraceae bacterium]